MFGKFIPPHIILLMAAIFTVGVSTEDETRPDWRKVANSGRKVEPEVKGRVAEPGKGKMVEILNNNV